MKYLIVFVLFFAVLADWQNGFYDAYGNDDPYLYGGVRDREVYDMIVVNPDKLSETYGRTRVFMNRPFNHFGEISWANVDLD